MAAAGGTLVGGQTHGIFGYLRKRVLSGGGIVCALCMQEKTRKSTERGTEGDRDETSTKLLVESQTYLGQIASLRRGDTAESQHKKEQRHPPASQNVRAKATAARPMAA